MINKCYLCLKWLTLNKHRTDFKSMFYYASLYKLKKNGKFSKVAKT